MNLEKIQLVFAREYLTRIKSKAFILSTLLAPIGLILLIAIPIVLSLMETEKRHVIGISDETGIIFEKLVEQNPERYELLENLSTDELRDLVLTQKVDGFVVFNEQHLRNEANPELFYRGTGGLGLVGELRNDIRITLQSVRLDQAEVGSEVRDILAMRTTLQTRKITETGEETQDTMALFFVGYIMFFIIYAAMFGYGAVIMRSVIEEKTNRIIEVITSSVKPFELLLGKVLGVGALGLTQFGIWSVTSAVLLTVAGPLALMLTASSGSAATGDAAAMANAAELPFTIPSIGAETWIVFVLFFLMGYLMYSALFAAVGSAVDSESDANQLMIPIMIPIMIPLMFIGVVASDPDSTFAVVTSLVPFFAPMLMPMRVAMSPVPFWEIGLAVILMVITFLGMIWISSRIYRVGILMYGKKASFRELLRWVRYS
jgi:ABC-2 type transport system permease protein